MSENILILKNLDIDSRNEHMAFMRRDCPVCIAEGFEALSRIRITKENKSIVASLIVLDDPHQLSHEQIGLSDAGILFLKANEGDILQISHLSPLNSMSDIRSKIYGNELGQLAFDRIIKDVAEKNLSNVQLSSFITACAGDKLSQEETIALTKSMINIGFKLDWKKEKVFDKHCIGGLPGNRTTPIVVSIVAAAGLIIPKTSSRAITSPAGTADTMEAITNVNLSIDQMKSVVEKEGGCLVWGGSVDLSPADDIIIPIERTLDIDSEGQLIASVLSKKSAAGSTHVLIDIPVGPTAKVRSQAEAAQLTSKMKQVGEAIGLTVEVLMTDGAQPVGRGIGPSLEAKDILSVLRNEVGAPYDLRQRAIALAGKLLEMGAIAPPEFGEYQAAEILNSGQAFEKFVNICRAQGAWKDPGTAPIIHKIFSDQAGQVISIDNRKMARVAKLAGAPKKPLAGVLLFVSLNKTVGTGDLLYEIHAENQGELNYVLEYVHDQVNIIQIQ